MQISIVKAFLESQNWQFTQLEEKNVLYFGIGGKNGNFQCIADLIEDENRFIFFSVCGANTPPEKKSLMLELLNTLNYKLFFGNFEMDSKDGEIRFRTNIPYENLDINSSFIGEVIMRNIIVMDKALPIIMNIIYGNIGVEDIQQVNLNE